jgi:dihydroneopterin aldolase
MIPLLDSKTKQTYSKEELQKMLVNLQYGYDMKLSGAQKDANRYTINYLCQIAQTKVVKQLNVIVEDDTARVVPMNLKAGEIFK